MRSLSFPRWVVPCFALALCAAATVATANPRLPIHRYHYSPRQGTTYQAWLRKAVDPARREAGAAEEPFLADSQWVEGLLQTPASIYSDLKPEVFSSKAIAGLPDAIPTRRVVAWDLGLDKALLGYQAFTYAFPDELGGLSVDVRANLIKSGVTKLYYQKAYESGGGYTLSTLAAELAVAAQVLSEWVDATPEHERDALGVRVDVLRRLERTEGWKPLPVDDLEYLADILRGELSSFRAGRNNVYRQRELPTPLRIARLAAAYRASEGFGYPGPCGFGGAANPDHAATDPSDATRPLCFTDATDRAVYAWYLAERERQLRFATLRCKGGALPCERLHDAFVDIRPMWVGALPGHVLAHAARAEVAELQIAQDLSPDELGDTTFLQLLQRAHLAVYPGVPR
jgi:hypothetical protein